jgi:hypothetical protein
MKLKTLSLAALSAFAITGAANAATALSLTLDVANSTAGSFSTSAADTLSDPFAYNPSNPTVVLPAQGDWLSVTGGWHANLGGGTLSYTLTVGAITTGATNSTIFFDLYGRTANLDRDNNYTVTLFNGNYATQVAQLTSQGVADASPYHNRSTFNLGTGVTFDRIQVTSSTNYFTVMEVRAASVPEPSAALLGGLGTLCLLRRRRA